MNAMGMECTIGRLLLLSGVVLYCMLRIEANEICYCMMLYKPVCGEDGVTYGNAECAKCAGMEKTRPGRCKDLNAGTSEHPLGIRRVARQLEVPDDLYVRVSKGPSDIDLNDSPAARLRRLRMERRKRGPMRQWLKKYYPSDAEPCICKAHLFRPICANDGYTHANADCAVKCSGVLKSERGSCDIVCPACYQHRYNDPVCDSAGVLYRNRCFAQCFGWSGELKEAASGQC